MEAKFLSGSSWRLFLPQIILPVVILLEKPLITCTFLKNGTSHIWKLRTSMQATCISRPSEAQALSLVGFVYSSILWNYISSDTTEVASILSGEDSDCPDTSVLIAALRSSIILCHHTSSLQTKTLLHVQPSTTELGSSFELSTSSFLLFHRF